MNILEYVIEKEVSDSIIRRLQKISENVLKGVPYSEFRVYMIGESRSSRRTRKLSQLLTNCCSLSERAS